MFLILKDDLYNCLKVRRVGEERVNRFWDFQHFGGVIKMGTK